VRSRALFLNGAAATAEIQAAGRSRISLLFSSRSWLQRRERYRAGVRCTSRGDRLTLRRVHCSSFLFLSFLPFPYFPSHFVVRLPARIGHNGLGFLAGYRFRWGAECRLVPFLFFPPPPFILFISHPARITSVHVGVRKCEIPDDAVTGRREDRRFKFLLFPPFPSFSSSFSFSYVFLALCDLLFPALLETIQLRGSEIQDHSVRRVSLTSLFSPLFPPFFFPSSASCRSPPYGCGSFHFPLAESRRQWKLRPKE